MGRVARTKGMLVLDFRDLQKMVVAKVSESNSLPRIVLECINEQYGKTLSAEKQRLVLDDLAPMTSLREVRAWRKSKKPPKYRQSTQANHSQLAKRRRCRTYLYHNSLVIECQAKVEGEVDGQIFVLGPCRYICTPISNTSVIRRICKYLQDVISEQSLNCHEKCYQHGVG